MESERSFPRELARFFSHLLFPGVVVGLHPSSLHRRIRKLRRFLEPLAACPVLPELVGDPETLIHRLVDAACGLAPASSPSIGGIRGRGVGEVGLLLGLWAEAASALCATNRVPLSYELTAANVVAEVSLTEELLAEANLGSSEVARKLLGDLAYRSRELEEELAESGIVLVTGEARARRAGVRQSR